jgi:hypothetical protein
MTNDERADRAQTALAVYDDGQQTQREQLVDLLTDLLHYMRRKDHKRVVMNYPTTLADMLETAEIHFNTEVFEEG